jgi:hypothetical protein
MRWRWLTIAVATLAVPSSALASTAWRLPAKTTKVGPDRLRISASRCGASKYGVYKISGRMVTSHTRGTIIYDVDVTRDGARHAPTHVHTTGTFPSGFAAALVAGVRSVTYELRDGYVWGVNANGTLGAAVLRFAPHRTHC